MNGKFKKNDAENMEQFTGAHSRFSRYAFIVAKTCRPARIDQSCCHNLFVSAIYRTFHLSQLVTIMVFYASFVQPRMETNSN